MRSWFTRYSTVIKDRLVEWKLYPIITNKHFFPAVLFLLVLTLSLFGVSGTSAGIYERYLEIDKSGAIIGEPEDIRSDEFLVNTQMIVAQDSAGYPLINKNIGDGQNMSIVIDVPYKEWSVMFKPLNIPFLVLPLDFAFAFKWWMMIFLLIISVYYFILEIMSKKKWLAILLSLAFAFSPFIHWWYQYITIAPLFFSFFIMTVLLKIHKSRGVRSDILWSLLLIYLLTCFALVIYPPFQIPCVLVVLAFYAALLITKIKNKGRIKKPLLFIVGSGMATLAILGVFILTRWNDIEAVMNTSYPGVRVVSAGNPEPSTANGLIFSSFLQPLFLEEDNVASYGSNQSEISNFFVTTPMVWAFGLFVAFASIRRRRYKDAVFIIAMLIIIALFLARMTIPLGDPFYKLLGLSSVPITRMYIGVGLSSFLLLLFSIICATKRRVSLSKVNVWRFVSANLLIYSILIIYSIIHAPDVIDRTLYAILFLLAAAVGSYILASGKFKLFAVLLAVGSFLTIVTINPLYRSIDIYRNNSISEMISETSKGYPGSKWIVSGNLMFENWPQINNAQSVSGVFAIPQINLFSNIAKVDNPQAIPSGNPTLNANDTINRFAHIIYEFDNVDADYFELAGNDFIKVHINDCGSFIEKNSIGFILSAQEIKGLGCFRLTETISSPDNATKFFLYRKVEM